MFYNITQEGLRFWCLLYKSFIQEGYITEKVLYKLKI